MSRPILRSQGWLRLCREKNCPQNRSLTVRLLWSALLFAAVCNSAVQNAAAISAADPGADAGQEDFAVSAAKSPDIPPPRFEDIVFALNAMEESLSSFRVHGRAEKKTRNSHTAEFSELWTDAVFAIDSVGRMRYEKSGTTLGGALTEGKPAERNRFSVYDGEVAKSMFGRDRFQYGNVGDPSVLGIGLDPRDYLYQFSGKKLTDRFSDSDKYDAPRWVEWEGQSLVELTSKGRTEENGDQFRSRYLFDPERGFFPVYRGGEIRFSSIDEEWREYVRVAVLEWTSTSYYEWLPARVHVLSRFAFEQPVLDNEPFPVSWDFDIRFDNWEVSPEFIDSYFELEFPAGVTITDEITGQVYKVTGVNQQQIYDHAAAALDLRQSGTEQRRWLVLVNVLLLISAIVFACFRSRRHRQVEEGSQNEPPQSP